MTDSPHTVAPAPRTGASKSASRSRCSRSARSSLRRLRSASAGAPEGPHAGFFPFYLGVVDPPRQSDEPLRSARPSSRTKLFAEWGQLGSVLSVVIPTSVYVVAVPWTGLYVGVAPADHALHEVARPLQRAKSGAVAIGTVISISFMFEKWFLVPLPKGPIEDFCDL